MMKPYGCLAQVYGQLNDPLLKAYEKTKVRGVLVCPCIPAVCEVLQFSCSRPALNTVDRGAPRSRLRLTGVGNIEHLSGDELIDLGI